MQSLVIYITTEPLKFLVVCFCLRVNEYICVCKYQIQLVTQWDEQKLLLRRLQVYNWDSVYTSRQFSDWASEGVGWLVLVAERWYICERHTEYMYIIYLPLSYSSTLLHVTVAVDPHSDNKIYIKNRLFFGKCIIPKVLFILSFKIASTGAEKQCHIILNKIFALMVHYNSYLPR